MTLRPDRTFDRFTLTRGSREALELAKAMAAGSARAPRLLLLYGAPGVGKTHLLQAILHQARVRQPRGSFTHTNAAELVLELMSALRGDSLDCGRDVRRATGALARYRLGMQSSS